MLVSLDKGKIDRAFFELRWLLLDAHEDKLHAKIAELHNSWRIASGIDWIHPGIVKAGQEKPCPK